MTIDPRHLQYLLHSEFDLPLKQVRSIATGPFDEICVAGGTAVHIFTSGGEDQSVIELNAEPGCLAVGGPEHIEPNRVYVGAAGSVLVFDADRQPVGSWQMPRPDAILTSIAVAENDVFAADAGNRLVWRFSGDGQILGQIGAADSERRVHGFVIPAPFFDVVIGAADLLHIANPGKLQIATYTFGGEFGTAWGAAGSNVTAFFGCCNPSHLAMFPDGRFVTSEKGIPRIKVYSPRGEFEAVVAGPAQLGIDEHTLSDPRFSEDRSVFDIAVDSRSRVVVLDAHRRKVLIFVRKDRGNTTGDHA